MTIRGHRARRGAYLVVAAIGLSALAAGGAMVVEGRWRDLTLAQARGASVAAAHAATVALGRGATLDEARDLAAAVAAEHPVAGRAARVDPLQDVVFGLWDFDGRAFDPTAGRVNAVEVRVRPPKDPLRWLFGGWSPDRTATSRAALRSRDLVVALDLADATAAEPAVQALADHLAFLALPDERFAVVPLAELDASEPSSWLGGERPLAARSLIVVSDGLCADPIRAGQARALTRALGEDGVHVGVVGVGPGTECLASLVTGFGRATTVPDASGLGAAIEAVARGVPVALVTP